MVPLILQSGTSKPTRPAEEDARRGDATKRTSSPRRSGEDAGTCWECVVCVCLKDSFEGDASVQVDLMLYYQWTSDCKASWFSHRVCLSLSIFVTFLSHLSRLLFFDSLPFWYIVSAPTPSTRVCISRCGWKDTYCYCCWCENNSQKMGLCLWVFFWLFDLKTSHVSHHWAAKPLYCLKLILHIWWRCNLVITLNKETFQISCS